MPKVIYKYPVSAGDSFTLELPVGAQYLHSCLQPHLGEVFMWLLVDPDAEKTLVKFRVVGTGHPIKDYDTVNSLLHLDTFFPEADGSLVFHLFAENVDRNIKTLEDVIGVMLHKTVAFEKKTDKPTDKEE